MDTNQRLEENADLGMTTRKLTKVDDEGLGKREAVKEQQTTAMTKQKISPRMIAMVMLTSG